MKPYCRDFLKIGFHNNTPARVKDVSKASWSGHSQASSCDYSGKTYRHSCDNNAHMQVRQDHDTKLIWKYLTGIIWDIIYAI